MVLTLNVGIGRIAIRPDHIAAFLNAEHIGLGTFGPRSSVFVIEAGFKRCQKRSAAVYVFPQLLALLFAEQGSIGKDEAFVL